MKIIEDLKQIILKAVKDSGFKVDEEKIKLEHPSDVNFGDYSTNIAMVLAKEENKNPRELANLVCQSISLSDSQLIKKIEVAGAGFINFYFNFLMYESRTIQPPEHWITPNGWNCL